jgi:phospholipase/carboxylesterase
LLLLLHGVGSHEGDLFSLESAFDSRFIVVSVRAPLTLRPGSYAWFPVQFTPQGPIADSLQAEKSRGLLAEFVAWAVKDLGADPDHVVVAGFSQGAIMSASLALTEPEMVKAAVLMSGRILPEVLSSVASTDRRKKTSYLVVHGTQDEVLPVAHGRTSRETLQSLGIDPEYHEFAMGHTISDKSLALVSGWINAR